MTIICSKHLFKTYVTHSDIYKRTSNTMSKENIDVVHGRYIIVAVDESENAKHAVECE